MGLLQNLGMALKIFIIFYIGIFVLSAIGIGISKWAFSYAGLVAVFFLAVSYSFYFKL
tara:strand:+ start:19347 stop:19520 length:174 start_codon:yes stop_codon:yes gene_type:complete